MRLNVKTPGDTLIWLILILTLTIVGSARAQESEGSGSATAETTIPGRGIYDTMPARPAGIPDMDSAKEPFLVPIDPTSTRTPQPPPGPETNAPDGEDDLGKTGAAAVPGDYIAYRNSNLTVGSNGQGPAVINEPSIGMNGRVVFYTGNWFAAFSDDAGQTFQYVDPYDNFPANGVNDVPSNSGGFCCDQVVHYVPSHGLMVWFLQYRKSGENPAVDSNVIRIAVANSQADVINNNWFYWTFDPTDFGFASTGIWFDYPDITYTNDFLYFTSNVFNIVAPNPPTDPTGRDTYNSTVIVRLPLDEIADGGNTSYHYWVRSIGTLRPVQNVTTRAYFGGHLDNNTLRIYHVLDNSTTLNSQDVNHAGFNTRGNNDVMNAPAPDGTNFAARSDTRILAAWRSSTSSEIGFMWNADESDGTGDISASYPYPYTRIVRIRTSDWSVQQQRSIWNTGYAWMYPSVNVNDRGHIAGTIAAGGGSLYPRSDTWIIDDYNSPAFPSLDDFEVHPFAVGNDGPNANTWGDYLTTRRMVPYGNTWVGTGFRLTGGGNDPDTVPEFIWFGRERDMPPAANTIYVNYLNSSGYEDGTSTNPFNTAEEGEIALQPGDHLRISTGTYNEQLIFNTQADVNNLSGTAVIVAGGPNANAEARLKAEEPPDSTASSLEDR